MKKIFSAVLLLVIAFTVSSKELVIMENTASGSNTPKMVIYVNAEHDFPEEYVSVRVDYSSLGYIDGGSAITIPSDEFNRMNDYTLDYISFTVNVITPDGVILRQANYEMRNLQVLVQNIYTVQDSDLEWRLSNIPGESRSVR